WDPATIDAVAYAFFDGEGEARLIRQAQEKDARAHAVDCTAGSLERLRAAGANGYAVDRSKQIPGFAEEKDEFMPRKAWYKRMAYDRIAASPRLDWKAHQHFFKEWADEAIEDHHLRTQQLRQGLAQYGLEGKLRRFNHHDTHAANSLYASGFGEALL